MRRPGLRRSAATLLALGLASAALVGTGTPADAAPEPGAATTLPGPGPYGAAGRWIVDADGRVLITSGVNMVNKRAPYAPDAVGFDDADAAFLAAHGFDSVRVGVIWKAVEPEPGRYDDAYLDRIAATVDTLARHGVTSLLDMHQDMYNERFQGEFAPDWAVLDDGLPAWPQLGFPTNQFLQPALIRAYDHFLANDPGPGGVGLQDRFAAAWGHVAARFAGRPGVLGYDVLNEPWPGSQWLGCVLATCPTSAAGLTALHQRVGAAIRAQDPHTLVFTEPFSLASAGAPMVTGNAGVANQGLSYHLYCPVTFVTGADAGCGYFDPLVHANADAYSRATGAALLVTEFGATSKPDVLAGVVDRAAAAMVGWQYWAYCGCNDPTTADLAEQGVVEDPAEPPTGTNVRAEKLALLSVPHPRSVAGTPLGYSFDRARHTLSLRYSTARADGAGTFAAGARSTVATPAGQYPTGYRVSAVGARVVSAPNAAVLEVAAEPGATEVSVSVSPAQP
ncbi:cellulase family glycosylhydrolase [Rhodococcus sp. X156]|uniref:cellulase family glycosylhydrolase n=1 Tax=Rhodococcus sp. X156 TaxID=2499145 RepID=UPI000FD87CEB|nr:cellulase family glycosylhydrolase [Rhodococcus sp. X156]